MRVPRGRMQAAQPLIGLSRDNDDEDIVGNFDLVRPKPVLETEFFGEAEILKVPLE